jgi:hypothetical protein
MDFLSERIIAMTTVPRTVHGDGGRGDWIRTSDLHTPSVMRYQAALRPDWPAHLGRATNHGKVRREAGWLGGGEKANRASGLGGF